jgi:hypothetical protein
MPAVLLEMLAGGLDYQDAEMITAWQGYDHGARARVLCAPRAY